MSQTSAVVEIKPKPNIESIIVDTNVWVSLVAKGGADSGDNSQFDIETMKRAQVTGNTSQMRGVIFQLLLANKLTITNSIIREFEKVTNDERVCGKFSSHNRSTADRILAQMKNLRVFPEPPGIERLKASKILFGYNLFKNYCKGHPDDKPAQSVSEKLAACELSTLYDRLSKVIIGPDAEDAEKLQRLASLRDLLGTADAATIKDSRAQTTYREIEKLEKIEKAYNFQENNWTDMELLVISGMANQTAQYNRVAIISLDKDLSIINQCIKTTHPTLMPAAIFNPQQVRALTQNAKEYTIPNYLKVSEEIPKLPKKSHARPSGNDPARNLGM